MVERIDMITISNYLNEVERIGINNLPETLRKSHPDLVISVDGGVNESNIGELRRAGALRFCIGAAIAGTPDPAAAYRSLRSAAEGAKSTVE